MTDPGRALVLRKVETNLRRLASVASSSAVVRFQETAELDRLVEEVGDDPVFREMFEREVSPTLRPILLGGKFDLPSSSLLAASPEDVVATLVAMVITEASDGTVDPNEVDEDRIVDRGDTDVSAMGFYVFMAAAEYLRMRGDWLEILDVVVDTADNDEERSLADWLYAAVYFEAGCPERLRDGEGQFDGEPADGLTLDIFTQLGLDGDTGLERIAEMIDDGSMPRFDRGDFLASRQRFAARQGEVRETASSAESERAAADAAADELDV